MPDRIDAQTLQRRLEALQADYPELDPLAVLVLLALRDADAPRDKGVTTSVLSRRLGLEHALIRRAATALEVHGLALVEPAGGASPALRLILPRTC